MFVLCGGRMSDAGVYAYFNGLRLGAKADCGHYLIGMAIPVAGRTACCEWCAATYEQTGAFPPAELEQVEMMPVEQR